MKKIKNCQINPRLGQRYKETYTNKTKERFDEEQIEDMIFVITGGEVEEKGGKKETTRIKMSTRGQHIVILRKNMEGIIMPHQDPVVIEVTIRKTKLL